MNEPNPSKNSKIDRLIAAYLAKDYLEDDDSEDGNYFLPEEKKKSYFRERDEKVGEFAFILFLSFMNDFLLVFLFNMTLQEFLEFIHKK